jgi:hypothetical protein
METEKTPGQVSWAARNTALYADPEISPGDALAALDDVWGYLTPGEQEAEEAGAQAVLENRTPWGDADAVSLTMWPKAATVRSGGPDGPVVKVIGVRDGELAYYNSIAEWEAANR